jgi:hypothetical protein
VLSDQATLGGVANALSGQRQYAPFDTIEERKMTRWVEVNTKITERADSAELRNFVRELREAEVRCAKCGATEPAGSSVPFSVQFHDGGADERRFFATHSLCRSSGIRRDRTRTLRTDALLTILRRYQGVVFAKVQAKT